MKQLNLTYNYKPILYSEFKTEFEVPASGKISFAVIDRKEREDIITASTFPQDFNFNSNSMEKTLFVCGMSVPPVMMKRVVESIIDCGVFNKAEETEKIILEVNVS